MKKFVIRKSDVSGRVRNEDQPVFDSIGFSSANDVLLEAKRYWDALEKFRVDSRRCRDYTFGDQWGDLIRDPSTGRVISEEQHILNSGKVPLKNNIMRPILKTVMGQYGLSETEPLVIARDRSEQKLSEMMTIVMQYLYSVNHLFELDKSSLQEFVLSGVCVNKIHYGYERNKKEAWVKDVNINRFFFNNNQLDPRGWDCNLIGEIHDMQMADVVSSFSNGNPELGRKIVELYRDVVTGHVSPGRGLCTDDMDNISFLTSTYPNLCRVIEVWKLESKERILCHDYQKGEYFRIELSEIDKINKINSDRIIEYAAAGVDECDVPMIETEWFVDRFWYCRYLTPYGDVLKEMETPYWHKSHPYSFKFHPLVDGAVHSFMADVIDQQRYINRLITMIDFIMGASAKGVLLFPEDQIPDGMTMDDVADEWTRYNGVILYKPKPGAPAPQQISTNSTNIGAQELLSIQMQLAKEVSGVYGALQGQAPKSGTAASLYSQQAENSSINLVDMFNSFKSFREDRDSKLMQVAQQFYNEPKYINIAGNDYSEESKYYDPERVKNVEFDLSIKESQISAAFRSTSEQFMKELVLQGALPLEIYLQNSSQPFADKLLERLKSAKSEYEEQHAGEQVSE